MFRRLTPGLVRRLAWRAAVTAAGLCVLCSVGAWGGSAKIGYVADMMGTWKLSGSADLLAKGERLAGGGVLVNENPSDQDFISVANLNGDVIKQIRCKQGVCRECRPGAGCYDPIQALPEAPAKPELLSVAWNGLLELFGSKPERYSMERVRGQAFDLKKDGIVALHGTSMDVAPLLQGQEPGTYEFRCSAISADSSAGGTRKSEIVTLDWSPNETAGLTFAGIHEGLYRLSARHHAEVSSAWILVVPAAEYGEWSTRFQQIMQNTESWGDSVSDETKRGYQRAYLEYLSNLRTGQRQ
jgi:hypothetical protein